MKRSLGHSRHWASAVAASRRLPRHSGRPSTSSCHPGRVPAESWKTPEDRDGVHFGLLSRRRVVHVRFPVIEATRDTRVPLTRP